VCQSPHLVASPCSEDTYRMSMHTHDATLAQISTFLLRSEQLQTSRVIARVAAVTSQCLCTAKHWKQDTVVMRGLFGHMEPCDIADCLLTNVAEPAHMNDPLPGSSGEFLRCHRKQVKVPVDCGTWSKLFLKYPLANCTSLCTVYTVQSRIQKSSCALRQRIREGKPEFRGTALRETQRGLLLSCTVTQKFRATV
jgi:hypothetical protein